MQLQLRHKQHIRQLPVTFFAEGLRLDGDLHLPADRLPGERLPALVACSGYPKCKATKPIQAAYDAGYEKPKARELEESCPECGKPLLVRASKRGDFVGCSGYPKCRYTRDMGETQ